MAAAGFQRGTFGLLSRPGPRWLWLGQLTSSAGDRLYAVALVWITAETTRSPAAVAVVSLAGSIPQLLTSLSAGRLARGRPPLQLARSIDLARAVLVLVVPALSLVHAVTLPVLITSTAALSALEGLFIPALQAGVPALVDRVRLGPMVALLDSSDRIGRILGPGLVGVLTIVLPKVQLFTLNAGTFLVSAATLTLLLRPRCETPAVTAPRAGSGRPSAWRLVATHPTIGPAVGLRVACNLAWPAFTIAAPFLVQQRTSAGITTYGLLIATFGAANLAGNLLAGVLRLPPALQSRLAWATAGAAFISMALTQSYPLLVAAAAFAGLSTPMANVTVDTVIAHELEPHDLAGTYGLQRSLVTAAGIGGLALLGVLETALGPTGALTAGGLWMLLSVLTSIAAVSVRTHRTV